ncbi:hypothetical protein ANOBCDAF_00544 [Pleomorphomonas sp. T1.2MG-36]|uniref:regulatory protein GemA n=1 Tax=Pleomorphomonas sp. T1.2MG-36 TaxID=3041167 RepID=UPI002477C17B|nr:regulatory protein GemA [Pleomorphomonas sp. T1.2MG-36]CAI9400709.1 hypothetical protein ANOBCDAF_00544 [Pleomorphomonas sp. T1.2MG-36]
MPQPEAPVHRIGRKQLAVIHMAVAELKLDDATYRDVLARFAGVTSAKGLDQRGFNAVMAYFTALGFRSTWTQRTFGRRPGMATSKQIDLIRKLWRGWSGADDEAALGRWLDHSFHVSALRFLDKAGADKAVNGLRAMICRKSSGG